MTPVYACAHRSDIHAASRFGTRVVKNASRPFRRRRARAYDGLMADLWVLVTVIGFFAVCVGFVWGCDRIIGPDEDELLDDTSADVPGEVVAR